MEARDRLSDSLVRAGLVAVVRAHGRSQALPVARALLGGGIRAVEITLTTPGAIEAIGDISRELGEELLPGAGTVLDADSARRSIDAGARYVVSPDFRPEVLEASHQAGVPVLMGAYTPSEMQRVHEAGSDFVKFFPAGFGGAAYVKAVRGPLPHLRIVPTGGVGLENMESFLAAGCPALGMGSSLVSSRILQQEAWKELEDSARAHWKRFEEARLRTQSRTG